jgi:rhomboid protease GluP
MIIGAFLALIWYLSYVSKLKTILKILGLLGAVINTRCDKAKNKVDGHNH